MDNQQPTPSWRDDPELSETWKFRFDFYERYGLPSLKPSAEFQAAFKALPFKDRAKINVSIWAFFFSFIYLFIIGLKRQAALTLGVLIVVMVVGIGVSVMLGMVGEMIFRALCFLYSALVGWRTTLWYYKLKTTGDIGWEI
ncbi:MAG: DUF2628 domain-containing protein [Azoarcus sp.]|jgi:hypothetical protein|nr:DUF2628 domain-containing protein [Azoarcus sp.]